MKKTFQLILIVLLTAAGLAALGTVFFFSGYFREYTPLIRPGQRLLFLGADTVQSGQSNYPNGFIHLSERCLRQCGTPVKYEFSGGNNSSVKDLNQRAVICMNHPFDWVFIQSGIQDVWNKKITPEVYEEILRDILRKVQCCGARPVLMTSCYQNLNKDQQKKAAAFNKILRDFARINGFQLVDWEEHCMQLQKTIAPRFLFQNGSAGRLTRTGNQYFAQYLLRVLGVPEKRIEQSMAEWQTNPENTMLTLVFTPEEWTVFQKGVRQSKLDQNKYVKQEVSRLTGIKK